MLTSEERKQHRRIAASKWKAKNKEKVKQTTKAYNKRYRQEHKEEIKIYQKQWRIKNYTHAIEYDRTRYLNNREREISRRKRYYVQNKKKANRVGYLRKKQRYQTDLLYKLKTRLRSRISNALRAQRTRKSNPTLDLLGCPVQDLRIHLANKFLPGMTWENHGKWHIDHIKPCASFNLFDPEEQKKCFHYSNLQPLWGRDNLMKKDRVNQYGQSYVD